MKNGKRRDFFLVVSRYYWFRSGSHAPQNDASDALWDTRSGIGERCVHNSQTLLQVAVLANASACGRARSKRHMHGQDMTAPRPLRPIQLQFMALARCSFASARIHLARLTGADRRLQGFACTHRSSPGVWALRCGLQRGNCRDAANSRRCCGRMRLRCLCQ